MAPAPSMSKPIRSLPNSGLGSRRALRSLFQMESPAARPLPQESHVSRHPCHRSRHARYAVPCQPSPRASASVHPRRLRAIYGLRPPRRPRRTGKTSSAKRGPGCRWREHRRGRGRRRHAFLAHAVRRAEGHRSLRLRRPDQEDRLVELPDPRRGAQRPEAGRPHRRAGGSGDEGHGGRAQQAGVPGTRRDPQGRRLPRRAAAGSPAWGNARRSRGGSQLRLGVVLHLLLRRTQQDRPVHGPVRRPPRGVQHHLRRQACDHLPRL